MPKNSTSRTIDQRRTSGGYTFVSSGSGGGGVTDHGLLLGLLDDDHPQYHNDTRGDLRYVPLTRQVTGTGGLTGGGALTGDLSLSLASSAAGVGLALSAGVLSVNVTDGLATSGDNIVLASSAAGAGLTYAIGVLAVGAGDGLTVAADSVALASTVAGYGLTYASGVLAVGAGDGISVAADSVALASSVAGYGLTYSSGVLDVAVANTGATGLTVEANAVRLTTDSDPGAAAKVLATNASGILTLVQLTATTKLRTPLLDTASGDLTLSPADDLVLSPADAVQLTDGKPFNGSAGFTSGFAGSGFELLTAGGKTALELDNLTVRGTMNIYELLIHQIRATNGSVFVSSTAKIATVSGTDPTYTLTTDGETAHGFLINDVIRAQRFTGSGTYQCNLTVTGVTDLYTFTATRVSGPAPRAGMEFVRLGNTTNTARQGTIYLTADDTGAPFIDVVDGVAAHSQWNTAGKVKARIGKLDGLSLPTPNTDEYGLWAGTGVNDAAQYIRVSNNGVMLNNVPLKLWKTVATVTTQRVNIDAAGTDVWFADAAGNVKLAFNGTDLTVAGDITANAGYIGGASGWAITSQRIASTNIKLDSAAAGTARLEVGTFTTANTAGVCSQSGGTGVVFWAGSTWANKATTAPFSVTLGGLLTATNVKVTAGGSGTKDVDLNGWNIDSTEIVGQKAGVDQVVLDTNGRVLAGAGKAMLDVDGVKLTGGTSVWQQGTALEWYATPSTKTTLYGRLGVFRYNTGLDTTRLYLQAKQVGADPADIMLETLNAAGAYVNSLRLSDGAVEVNSDIYSGGYKVWHAGNDGYTSGLIAEDSAKLGGTAAASYSLTSHNHTGVYSASGHTHSYAPLGGATFTGAVTMQDNLTMQKTVAITSNISSSELSRWFDIGVWRTGSSAAASPSSGYARVYCRQKPTNTAVLQLIVRFPNGAETIIGEETT